MLLISGGLGHTGMLRVGVNARSGIAFGEGIPE
jgi:hypothetical protein